MSSYVIHIHGLAMGVPSPYDDQYIAGDYTPEYQMFGQLDTTPYVANARRFASSDKAWDFWKQEHPQGMGGQNIGGVNRPLTAFTVSIFDPDAAPAAKAVSDAS